MDATRLAPLSGVAATVLVVASTIASGTTPAADAPVSEVVSFYEEHGTGQIASAVLLSGGALFLLLFAATLATAFRRSEATRGPTILFLSGAAVLAVGLSIFASLSLALGDLQGDVDDTTLRALNVLSQTMVFPVTLGVSACMLGAGFAVLRSSVVSRWLGWVALACGLVAAVPSHVLGGVLDHIGFAGFIGMFAWTLVVGVLLAMRPAT
jgi:hypothetical protein